MDLSKLKVTPTLIDEEKAAPSPEVSKSQEHHKETAIKVAEGQPQKTEQVLEKSEHTTTRKKSKQLQKPTPPTEEKKAKREYQHLRGPLRSSNLRHGTTPLADLEKEPPVKQTIESLPTEKEPPALLPSSFYNMLKIQAGRPPQRSSALTFDDSGNVTSVRKLDITKLPRHEVEVLWEVVEPTMKAKHSCNETLHSVNSKLKIQTVADSTLKKEKQKGKLEPKKQVFLSTLLDPSDGMLPGPLPTAGRVLWDSMELSPGVTVADPLGKKRASFREPSWLHSRDIMDEETLRPIQATVQRPTATTEQMITGKAAMVRGNPVKPFKDEKAELFLNFSTSPVQLSSKLRKICDEQSQLFTEISEITLSKAAFATIEVRPKIPQKPIPPTEEKKTNKEYQYPRWAHRLPILHRITKPQAESMEKCLVLPLSASKTSPKLLPTSFQTLPKILARQPLLSNKAATFHEFDHVSPLQILDAAKMTMNPVDMTLKVVDPSTGEVCLRAKPSNARNYQRSISLKQSTRELETFNLGDRLPSTIDDFYLPPFHCKNQTLSRSQGPKHHIFSCGDHHTSQEIYSAQHGLVSVNDTMIWDSMELSSKIIDRDSGGNRHFSLKEVPQHLHRYNLNSEAARSIKIPSANDKDIFVSLFSNINKPQDQVKSKLRKLNDAHPWQVEQYSEVNLNKTEIIPGGTKAKYLQKPSPPAQEKKNNREYQRHRVHFRSGSLQCNTTSSADPELTFLPKRAFGTLPEIKKNPKYLRTSKYNTFENKAESWPKFNRFRPFNEFANISSLQGTEPGKIHRQLMELTWEIVDPSVGEVHLRLKSPLRFVYQI
ncbi:uncharacterized protein LOC120532040 [Polypterus senegalus]|uniref:uncharacterized protein LOC120532040 n=1 Tax=Polypterus senegalus TaxID=55291 RepID=UPI0019654FFA|nr:uncharacterized protein LOC120532040 [Polypterus senegalus]